MLYTIYVYLIRDIILYILVNLHIIFIHYLGINSQINKLNFEENGIKQLGMDQFWLQLPTWKHLDSPIFIMSIQNYHFRPKKQKEKKIRNYHYQIKIKI